MTIINISYIYRFPTSQCFLPPKPGRGPHWVRWHRPLSRSTFPVCRNDVFSNNSKRPRSVTSVVLLVSKYYLFIFNIVYKYNRLYTPETIICCAKYLGIFNHIILETPSLILIATPKTLSFKQSVLAIFETLLDLCEFVRQLRSRTHDGGPLPCRWWTPFALPNCEQTHRAMVVCVFGVTWSVWRSLPSSTTMSHAPRLQTKLNWFYRPRFAMTFCSHIVVCCVSVLCTNKCMCDFQSISLEYLAQCLVARSIWA